MAVRGFHGTPQIAQTINTTSAGATHRAMPIQKPKSFFVNVIGSVTNGCLLVGFTMHRTPRAHPVSCYRARDRKPTKRSSSCFRRWKSVRGF